MEGHALKLGAGREGSGDVELARIGEFWADLPSCDKRTILENSEYVNHEFRKTQKKLLAVIRLWTTVL